MQADWIDDEELDVDHDQDVIQSNRDQLQLEDESLSDFLDWGRRRLRWALSVRDDLKGERQRERLQENPALDRLISNRPKRERRALTRVASAVARLAGGEEDEVTRVMKAVIDARETETTAALTNDIAMSGGEPGELFGLLDELGQLDARRSLSFVDARLEALGQAETVAPDEAVRWVHRLLSVSPGLLSPEWDTVLAEPVAFPAEGVTITVLQPLAPTSQAVVVLAIEPGVLATDATAAVALLTSRYPRHRHVVIGAEPSEATDAMGWTQLVAASKASHVTWRTRLVGRVKADPAS